MWPSGRARLWVPGPHVCLSQQATARPNHSGSHVRRASRVTGTLGSPCSIFLKPKTAIQGKVYASFKFTERRPSREKKPPRPQQQPEETGDLKRIPEGKRPAAQHGCSRAPASRRTVPGPRFLDGSVARGPRDPPVSPLQAQPEAAAGHTSRFLAGEGPRGLSITAKPKPAGKGLWHRSYPTTWEQRKEPTRAPGSGTGLGEETPGRRWRRSGTAGPPHDEGLVPTQI